MQGLGRIDVLSLYPELEAKLVELLRGLSPEDWQRPTVARLWTIKDIAAHLLDGHLRKLSYNRDSFFGVVPEKVESYADLVAFLNGLNSDWVKAARRLSPAVLIELIAWSSREVVAYYRTLDPEAKSLFSVAWAGEEESQNWFDLAREYTERWHHQQQIRLAVDKPGELMTPRFYRPLLDTFMRALPHTYRDASAAEGTVVEIEVPGAAGGKWFLRRAGARWNMVPAPPTAPASSTSIPAEIAWQIFTKAIPKDDARSRVTIRGDVRLGERVLEMVSVMA